MPTVNVPVKLFDSNIGVKLTFEQLETLCFEFGIEVEYVKSEKPEEEDVYAFETCSNRADLLCSEGILLALRMYLNLDKIPPLKPIAKPQLERIIVKESTKLIRPYVVGAIIRNVKFTPEIYNSFIEFQDKLHQNICRKRSLVAIGTHDYDTIKGPFIYDARAPKEIVFAPLNKTEAIDGEKLMETLQNDLKLKAYLHLIKDSPVYPVIYDSNGVVLSLPPIINGNHSKITLDTKNIFIECTALDLIKCKIVINTITSIFSKYSQDPYSYEEVEIFYEKENTSYITPEKSTRKICSKIDYLNKIGGFSLEVSDSIPLFAKMGLPANRKDEETIEVEIPIYRADILHECDIAEDLAIAYGFNNITEVIPSSVTIGSQLVINQISDSLRQELASSGYQECLNFVLCSIDELTNKLLNHEEKQSFVVTANPKILDTQAARNTLLIGLLKSLATNKTFKLPLKLFEVGDIVLKCDNDVGARNERRIAAIYCDNEGSGFELIHGILDYVMCKLNVKFSPNEGYSLIESKNCSFFPGRQANILFKNQNIGIMGILHPEVLKKFDIIYPTSFLEINLEPLVENFFKSFERVY